MISYCWEFLEVRLPCYTLVYVVVWIHFLNIILGCVEGKMCPYPVLIVYYELTIWFRSPPYSTIREGGRLDDLSKSSTSRMRLQQLLVENGRSLRIFVSPLSQKPW